MVGYRHSQNSLISNIPYSVLIYFYTKNIFIALLSFVLMYLGNFLGPDTDFFSGNKKFNTLTNSADHKRIFLIFLNILTIAYFGIDYQNLDIKSIIIISFAALTISIIVFQYFNYKTGANNEILNHRGISHSLFFMIVSSAPFIAIGIETNLIIIPISYYLGFLSHIFTDIFGRKGMMIFFPITKKIRIYNLKEHDYIRILLNTMVNIAVAMFLFNILGLGTLENNELISQITSLFN